MTPNQKHFLSSVMRLCREHGASFTASDGSCRIDFKGEYSFITFRKLHGNERSFVTECSMSEIEELPPKREDRFLRDFLWVKVTDLNLGVRELNVLENMNIKYVGELIVRSEAEMLRSKNFGKVSLLNLKECLMGIGLYLGMKFLDVPDRDELDRLYYQHSGLKNETK